MVPIKEGDFVVDKGRWQIVVHQVVKVTDKCFYYKPKFRTKPLRQDRHSVVFSGKSEEAANKLCDQLSASRNQQYADEIAAREAREKRDKELIALAASNSATMR